MSHFKKEHFNQLKIYFSVDDEELKIEIFDSFPSDLREKVILLKEELEKDSEAKSIAEKIKALNFETEIEEFKSIYNSRKLDLEEHEFEKEIKAAITQIEREQLKKKLIELEENRNSEASEVEIKSAITQIEREALKKTLQKLENSLTESKISENKPQSKIFPLYSILKYAAAACLVFIIGFGLYQFAVKEKIQRDQLANGDRKSLESKIGDLPELETIHLEEIVTSSNSFPVLKSGLGYGYIQENVTIDVNNQKERIISIEMAISIYSYQLEIAKEIQNPEIKAYIQEISDRIASLQEELNQLTSRENQYLFDGKILTLYTNSDTSEFKVIFYQDNYYLKAENKFFRIDHLKELKPLQKETDTNVLDSLDKIIFNAD